MRQLVELSTVSYKAWQQNEKDFEIELTRRCRTIGGDFVRVEHDLAKDSIRAFTFVDTEEPSTTSFSTRRTQLLLLGDSL